MAKLTRLETVALIAGGAVALLCPLVLLPGSGGGTAPTVDRPQRALGVPDGKTLDAVYARPLFAPALSLGAIDAPLPSDAPELLGIAGRLGAGAVAFVRTRDDGTRSLAPGDSVDGWRLVSLAIDAAYFERGGEQVRVPLPVSDTDGDVGAQ